MNWDQIEGNWKELNGQVKEKWASLTVDDLTAAEDRRDQLVGAIHKRYGYTKDRAERELDEFARDVREAPLV